jgi:type IV secretion system protein VirB10
MKSKLTQDQEPEENSEEKVEVGYSGPAIAAAKKNKIAIIAASSVLITIVVYFLFFKNDNKKPEKLQEVLPPVVNVAPSDQGKSPFEIELPQKSSEDITFLSRPATPEVPTLPEMPANNQNQPSSFSPLQHLLPEPKTAAQQQNAVQQQLQTPEQNVVQQPEKQPEKKPEPVDPRYAPIVVFSGTAQGTPGRGVGYENNIVQLNKDPIADLQKSKVGVTTTYINDRSHTIAQGKLLTAVLETAIDTELPGSVRAVISHDVYGEAGSEVLIPRGSRLFGSYSSKISRGQGRVDIGWTRLIRSDGVDLTISFNASDQFGRAGIAGEVDNKYGSIITSAMLTSVLAVGGVAAAQQLLNNNSTTTTTVNPTQGSTTTTGNATNQAIYDVSKTLIDTVSAIVTDAINTNPVIRVPQGTRVTVIVNADINIPAMSKAKF